MKSWTRELCKQNTSSVSKAFSQIEKVAKKSWQLFTLIFLYNAAVALFVQTIGPLLAPPWHLGNGLFLGDAVFVHESALRSAQIWKNEGWSSSLLTQPLQASLWTSFLGFWYAFACSSPLAVIPIQALIQAACGAIVFLGLSQIGFHRVACLVGALTASCFPVSLEWSAQLQKDGLFCLGILSAFFGCFIGQRFPHGLCLTSSGCAMIFLARPNFMRPLIVMLLLLSIVFSLARCSEKEPGTPHLFVALTGLLFSVSLFFLTRVIPEKYNQVFSGHEMRATGYGAAATKAQTGDSFPPRYEKSARIPKFLDSIGFEIYGFRTVGLLVGGRSIMDEDTFLNSFGQQISYLPRALQIGLFAPFPAEILGHLPDGRKDVRWAALRTWKQKHSASALTSKLSRFLAVLQLSIYPSILGLTIFWFQKQNRVFFWGIILYCLPVLCLLTESYPNLGTLTRLKYPFWILICSVGNAAVFHFLYRQIKKESPKSNIDHGSD